MSALRWKADRNARTWHYGDWTVAPDTGGRDRWERVLHWSVLDPAGNNRGNHERLFDAKRGAERLAAR